MSNYNSFGINQDVQRPSYGAKREQCFLVFFFSYARKSRVQDTALDVVCLDCEMVYTTGGSRVARVSVIDGSGKEVYDELVKMDEGVEVM